MTLPTLNLEQRSQTIISLNDEQKVISRTRPSELIYLRECKNATITLESCMFAKIIIENCTSTQIKIASEIISGTIEVINSESLDLSIEANSPGVPTLMIDGTKSFHCSFANLKQMGLVLCTDCSEVSLTMQGVRRPLQFAQTNDSTSSQSYITKLVGTTPVTEPVVREGAGYCTTAREKAAADLRDRQIEEALIRLLTREMNLPSGPGMELDSIQESTAETTPQQHSNANTREASRFPLPNNSTQPQPQSSTDTESGVTPAPVEGHLDAIRKFSQNDLQATTTVERTMPVVSPTPLPHQIPKPSSGAKPPGQRYGHSREDDITEFEDSPEVIRAKVKTLAKLIRKCTRGVVVHTGAGISTSAKIPDYRGPQGVWTLRDRGLSPQHNITLEQARPTYGHRAIAQLVTAGIVKTVVSTNVDGLHLRSGIPLSALAELHGNCYVEKCSNCDARYVRDFDVCRHVRDHRTGRKCEKPGCSGNLLDSIINFSENLPERELTKAADDSENADLSIVLGTSMRVSPACNLPLYSKTLCIVNLQKTPFDSQAHIRIFGRTDQVLEMLLQELGMHVPDEDPGSALAPSQALLLSTNNISSSPTLPTGSSVNGSGSAGSEADQKDNLTSNKRKGSWISSLFSSSKKNSSSAAPTSAP